MAKVDRKWKNSISVILIEIVSFLFIFVGSIGMLLQLESYRFMDDSVIALAIGIVIIWLLNLFRRSWKLVCSKCLNSIEDKKIKMCPVCRVSFD